MEPRISGCRLSLVALLPLLLSALAGCATQGLLGANGAQGATSSHNEVADRTARQSSATPADASTNPHPPGEAAAAPGAATDQQGADDEDDLWARIRAGLAIPRNDNDPRIAQQREWFIKNQQYLDRVADRARLYMHYVVAEAQRRGLPTDLALIPVIESAYQPFAYSPSHAAGLWQFVPSTARRYGLKLNWWFDGRRDIIQSTNAAFDYLEKLHNDFNGNWLLAIAAYNYGEGNVQRAIERNLKAGKPTDFWSLPLPNETRSYVPRLLAVASIVAHPARYGVRLKPIPDQPFFKQVQIKGQIELARAAHLAHVPVQELYMLNPGLNRWATAPNGPYRLLVPVAKAAVFKKRLEDLPPQQRVAWYHHRVRRGETLGGIARRYKTTVAVLARLNKLHGTLIHTGANLIVPVPASSAQMLAAAREDAIDGGVSRTTPVSTRGRTYTVHAGDTLWGIARRFGTSVHALVALNGIPADTVLQLGQELKVSRAHSPARAIPAVASVHTRRHLHYRVRHGDSLWDIAQRFGVTVHALRRWNGLRTGRYLHPGERLDIYVDVTNAPEQS